MSNSKLLSPRFPICILLVLLGPLAGPTRADDFPPKNPWEAAIRRFEQQDEAHGPEPGGIVFVGSSSIRLWNLKKSFPDLPVINRGFGGSQVADSVYFAERIVIKYRPRLVVFYAGDNDLAAGKSAETVRDDFAMFASRVTRALPETRILFLAIKPSPARWKLLAAQKRANDLIREYIAGKSHLEYVDVATPLVDVAGQPRRELFAADGLHLNDQGYALWTKIVGPKLDK
jgi:lysophospholipase L1-like esterase